MKAREFSNAPLWLSRSEYWRQEQQIKRRRLIARAFFVVVVGLIAGAAVAVAESLLAR